MAKGTLIVKVFNMGHDSTLADLLWIRAKGYGDTHEQDMISRYVRGVRDNLDTRMNRTEEETQKLKFD